MKKWIDVLYPRVTHYAANKENTFPFLFLGYILFFCVFFNNFGQKNKGMLRYNGGTSVTNIQVQGARTRLMFRIMILGKNPPGAKGVKMQRQSATGLAYKACFRWFS
jgi:hypothetical protein